jgi:hypothetical protein
MTVRPSAAAPDGFLVYSHADDDFRLCRDHVRKALGIDFEAPREKRRPNVIEPPAPTNAAHHDRTGPALDLWRASVDPRGTAAERYLERERGLNLGDDIAGGALRWSPRLGAMVALFRNITTGEPQAVSRTFLTPDARKIERKFFGPVGGAAIMIDPFDAVTTGLHIGEGIETCLAARSLGLRPTWALGSAGAIAVFPILAGVECLTLLAEHDDASARAVNVCAARWHGAAREVFINRPIGGKDLNDALRGSA